MVYVGTLYKLKGAALDELARALYEQDVKAFEDVIVELVKLGGMRDYETAAAMLATVPIRAKSGAENYADAAFGAIIDEQYFNMFIRACTDLGYPESEYIKVLLSAQYGQKDGAFYAWDKSVDRYLTALAASDFERAAEYVERYDRKYNKYRILISVDRDRALNRLLAMALYVKNIDRAAVRDVLMDYDEVSDVLMDIYDKSKTLERVYIVRLLAAYKNDGRVRRFLDEVVARDKSKSVRDAAFKDGRAKKQGAAHFLEGMMADGEGLTVAEWTELLSDPQYAEVADRVFFYTQYDEDRIGILVYDDNRFLDSSDAPVQLDPDKKIYVLHPVDVGDDNSAILSLDIDQPFLQIKRPVYGKSSGENFYSMRLAGTMTARDVFDKNLKALGFVFCDKRGADECTTVLCRRGKYSVGVECDLTGRGIVSAGRIVFFESRDIVKIKRKQYISTASPVDMSSVPPRAYSELMYCAYKLFQAE